MEYAVKLKKPILVIRDVSEVIPQIPEEWKAFKKILNNRTQVYSAYYSTELAELMQLIHKYPTDPKNSILYCDFSFYSV